MGVSAAVMSLAPLKHPNDAQVAAALEDVTTTTRLSYHVSFADDHHQKRRLEDEAQAPNGVNQAQLNRDKDPADVGDEEEDDDDDDDDDDDCSEEDESWEEIQVDKEAPVRVDERDAGTADEWILRHPEMVRLTGRHPFNSEPPLPKLMEKGFITPTSLHYVRNHGPVPRAAWGDWRIQVCGLVKKPAWISMSELCSLPAREIPVTLVCAGNRRKEENMVKQSVGFNWGAAGVGTSVWKGARLCDVLYRCGVQLPRRRRSSGPRYVCFEGGDALTKCGGGGYGTCISLEKALDETQDVILAYEQNGRALQPDHGFPVRLIVPGCIGGRMVKWLNKIEVTAVESANYYHYEDNKVLPSHVDSETAAAEGWWRRPEYVINELNINSVITTPAHGETLPITPATMQAPYKLRGYAYSGGGRKVNRVEVTLDGGESWLIADLAHPEKPTKYGKFWCWSFWELDVEVVELLQARELAVRAWDESMNTQPRDLIWNLMGMMNNCWFRVKMHPCKGKLGGVALSFEHPTRPGNQSGGWMVKQKEEIQENLSSKPKPLTKSASSPFLNKGMSTITMSEVRKHSKADSPWIVVNNSVYDCTSFLKDHPGGADSILINAGSDCTEEFEAIHSSRAKALLEDFKIGEIVTSTLSFSSDTSPESSLHGGNRALSALNSFSSLTPILEALPSKSVALNPKQNISCDLVSSTRISADLRRLRFALPGKYQVFGLPVGKHVFISAKIDGKLCMRAYTPVSSDDDEDCVGHFELLIRVYFRNVHPNFPNGGIMSQHLDSLKVGESVNVKGPLGHIHYKGKGEFSINGEAKFVSEIAMLAGGTGITPVYQVVKAVLRDARDFTRVSLIYANRSENDVMLKEELDAWEAKHSNFRVWYVLSNPLKPEEWKYSTGFITEEIVRDRLPKGSEETAAFMCGPPPMIEFACIPNLIKHGYSRSSCYQF